MYLYIMRIIIYDFYFLDKYYSMRLRSKSRIFSVQENSNTNTNTNIKNILVVSAILINPIYLYINVKKQNRNLH